jgi:hypothetical protein
MKERKNSITKPDYDETMFCPNCGGEAKVTGFSREIQGHSRLKGVYFLRCLGKGLDLKCAKYGMDKWKIVKRDRLPYFEPTKEESKKILKEMGDKK